MFLSLIYNIFDSAMEFLSKDGFLMLVSNSLPRIISSEVRHYIACQFALESNFGTSPSSCFSHNLCGMRVPAIRLTYCLNYDDKGQFAKYLNESQCISDYVIYLQALKFNRFELSLIPAFRRKLDLVGYCPDLGYLDRIDSIYIQYFDPNFNF